MGAWHEVRSVMRLRILQLVALTGGLAFVGGYSFYIKLCVIDNDIWWHLKVGDWIVEHLAVPHTGILSRTAATRPWVAYSWGYEVLMSFAYKWLGLLGIGLYGTVLTIAVAYSVYWMLRYVSGRFWISLTMAGIACSAFLFNGMPRPVFFSMVLFCVTLALLIEAIREGKVQRLYWLPLIFVLWANLHIQFIYGLFLVGLLLVTVAAQKLVTRWNFASEMILPTALEPLPIAGIFAACVVATLIGPNFYHPYIAVFEYSKAKFAYAAIIELQPLSFRGISHYVELLLAGFGFFAVGWRKKIDLFKLTMMTICSVVAFRTMRDAWFVVIPAAACIVDFPAPESERDPAENWMQNFGVAAAVAVLLLIIAPQTKFTERELDRAISNLYPVNAVNFLRRNPQPGPLYNNLGWGGFLIWYMPDYPVAIDGRNDLYGDEIDQVFYASENADTGYKTDPYLNESGVVLLDASLPLAKVLTIDPRFRLIYQDAQSVVYARR